MKVSTEKGQLTVEVGDSLQWEGESYELVGASGSGQWIVRAEDEDLLVLDPDTDTFTVTFSTVNNSLVLGKVPRIG
jgi:hypothetical protein